MKRLSLITIIAMSLSLVHCGDDNTDGLPDLSNLSAFQKADNAFGSTAAIIDPDSASGSSLTTKATCDGNGDPSTLTGTADYGGDRIFCQLNVNSKSPDTIQGSYFLASSIMCAVDKLYSFTYSTTPTTENNLVISESDSCFGTGGFDSDDDGNTTGSIVLSLREQALTGQDYDYLIELQLGATNYNASNSGDVNLYLKDSSGILAAKIAQATSITEFVINTTTNTVFFNNRDAENFRHIRARIDGTLNATTGTFTSVTLAKVIYGQEDDGLLTSNGDHSVIFGYDGTNEYVDHYQNDAQISGYPSCSSASCTGLETTYNRAFLDFNSNSLTSYNNGTLLDLSTFTMSF